MSLQARSLKVNYLYLLKRKKKALLSGSVHVFYAMLVNCDILNRKRGGRDIVFSCHAVIGGIVSGHRISIHWLSEESHFIRGLDKKLRQFAARLQGTGDAASTSWLTSQLHHPAGCGLARFLSLPLTPILCLILYLLPAAFFNLSSAKC